MEVKELSYEDWMKIKGERKLTEDERKRWRKVYKEQRKEIDSNFRKEHYKNNKEREQSLHKIWLENNVEQQKQYRKEFWIKNKEKKLADYDRIKISVYSKLGGCKCAICGDSELSHLTIDHINKNGSSERKKGLTGYTLLRAVEKGTLSNEQLFNLRILCWNHNKSRERDYMDLPTEKQTTSQRHIHKLWKEAFNFFGPCKTCGSDELKFLSINHINNDGANRRRNGEKQGPKLLSDFRKMGWPESLKEIYSLECFTCNCSRLTKRTTLISPLNSSDESD